MYGVAFRAVVFLPLSVLLAVIVEPFFEVAAEIIAGGPEGATGIVYTAVSTLSNVFLLTLVFSILFMILGRAAVEGRLGGGA